MLIVSVVDAVFSKEAADSPHTLRCLGPPLPAVGLLQDLPNCHCPATNGRHQVEEEQPPNHQLGIQDTHSKEKQGQWETWWLRHTLARDAGSDGLLFPSFQCC